MEKITLPAFVVYDGYNIDVPFKYYQRYGNYNKYINSFFDTINNKHNPKPLFLDLVKTVSPGAETISFVLTNDARVAGRRYQEAYFCQTPLCYAYDDLFRLFKENVPLVRQRNLEQTIMEPLVPELCAKFLILKALIESTKINDQKYIALTLGSKSLKMSYTYDPELQSLNDINIKKEYFDIWGVNFDEISYAFTNYVKKHRSTYRFSYFKGIQTLEILFNVRKTTFKKYANINDDIPLLTKAEYDIYNFVRDRGGGSSQLIADEFGYKSSRVVRYHLKKLINLKLIEKIGKKGSHGTIYRIL